MKRILVMAILALSCTMAFAQKEKDVKRPDSYNYNRGVDEYESHNYSDALTYFNKELQENPKNGYAYCWMALIYLNQEEVGRALSASDNAIKYISKKDSHYLATSYYNRGGIYLTLGDTIKALADIDAAIRIAPKEPFGYGGRARLYYELKQYDLSIADYMQVIRLDHGSSIGYMGLGRNYNAQEKWKEAIEQFNRVISLYSDYVSGYSFRAESYIGLEDWSKAADDIISALTIEYDLKAIMLMYKFKEAQAFDILRVKLKIQMDMNPNDALWPYYLGLIYENAKQYDKAITYYKESNEKDVNDVILSRISVCYDELGDFEQALKCIDEAIELDQAETDYLLYKASYLEHLRRLDESLAVLDSYQQENPEEALLYYNRGDARAFLRDYDGAIEDLTTCIILGPEIAVAYSERADLYTKQGKTDLATADYRKVIEMEDSPEKYEYSMFSYHALGDDDKAIAVMDTIISRSHDLRNDYYEASCLYSRMENKEKALEYLEKAFEEGYNKFNHIRMDYDMDFLRDTEEFKSLCDKYETQHKATIAHDDNEETVGEEVVTEVPFTRDRGGTYQVECKINDLSLYFIFDTGASDISISKVEADFMLKNGYLTAKDVVGNTYFQDANGNFNPGTIINLRQVEFGGLILENVQASVVPNQRAPLLLGQSVLSRLGKIEIDNTNHVLKITHTK